MLSSGKYHANLLLVAGAAILSFVGAIVLLQQPLSGGQGVPDYVPEGDPEALTAIAIQLQPGVDGIALIDRQNETICIYQIDIGRVAHEKLILLAARSFRYDRQLEDFNTAEPRPETVKKILNDKTTPKAETPSKNDQK